MADAHDQSLLMGRKAIPETIQTKVLTESGRRCALCFGIDGDLSEKTGQVAHVDRRRDNNAQKNLVFLCLQHHDRYDSSTRQSKGITPVEVIEYRRRLYKALRTGLGAMCRLEDELGLARAAIRDRDAAIIEHDTALFSQSDLILPEMTLRAFLADLQTNDAYFGSQLRAVDRFRGFFSQTGNHYLSSPVAGRIKVLISSLSLRRQNRRLTALRQAPGSAGRAMSREP